MVSSRQILQPASSTPDRLVGLVVRRPPRERQVPGSNPACDGIFSGSSHTSDLNIGTPVATLPGAWRYRVSAGTDRPGVSILLDLRTWGSIAGFPAFEAFISLLLYYYYYCLPNGCVTRLVCWWAWSCLSAPASNLHRWLASCLQLREKESIVHQSLPAST